MRGERVTTTKRINDVLARDKGLCVLRLPGCTLRATLADHRANRGSGGSKVLDAIENLIAACVLCNGAKEDADETLRAELIARGVRVEKHSTNAKTLVRCRATPVRYPDGVERWLTEYGTAEVVF